MYVLYIIHMSEGFYKRMERARDIVYSMHNEGAEYHRILEAVFMETSFGERTVKKIIKMKETIEEIEKEKGE